MRFIVCVGLMLLSYSANAVNPPKITIAHFEHPLVDVYKAFFVKSYGDIGYRVELVSLPITRGVIESNTGNVDALAVGIDSISELYPNLVRSGPPIAKGTLTLFCFGQVVCDRAVLADNKNTLFMTKGAVRLAQRELNLTLSANLYLLDVESQLLDMIDMGRVTYMITGLPTEKSSLNVASDYVEVRLGEYYLYHHLNNKRSSINTSLAQSMHNNLTMLAPYFKYPAD